MPLEIAFIIGDVLHNARAALDNLACQLVSAAGNTPTNQTAFPIGDSEKLYHQREGTLTKGMSPAAVKAIRAVKPFKGGSDSLWRLHRLNIVDKHRLVLAVGGMHGGVDVGTGIVRKLEEMLHAQNPSKPKPTFTIPPIFLRPAHPSFPLRAGDALYTDGVDAEITDTKFSIHMVIDEPGVVDREDIDKALGTILTDVEAVVPSFRPLLGH